MRTRTLFLLLVCATLCALPAVARAEGTAQLGTSQALRAATDLSVDILQAGETITWTGTGTVLVTAPDGTFATTLISGIPYITAQTGVYRLDIQSDQSVGTAWDVTVRRGATLQSGRLFSRRWIFNAGDYTEARATNGSFYAAIPGGTNAHTAVVEMKLDGLSGFEYEVGANNTGVNGPNAGRSVPSSGNSFTAEYPLYVNPPENATYTVASPALSNVDFGAGTQQCNLIVPGVTSGTFTFDSNVAGTYHILCDLNQDGQFNIVSDEDRLIVGDAVIGTNTATWDGTDNAGAPVAPDVYTCRIRVQVGEFHYVANDVETSYEGLRLFSLDPARTRTGLDMFWNDFFVQGNAVTMPNGQVAPITSGATGVNAGLYSSAADPTTPGINTRAWGNFNSTGVSRGNNAFLDTFAWVASATSADILVTTIDANQDDDTDGVPTYVETCTVGSDPTVNDTDGDGINDFVESDGGQPIDTDGDGIVDAIDRDSDADGVDDLFEGATDADGDGTGNWRDTDDDGDGILTSTENPDPNGDLDPADAQDSDGDGTADYLDADDDGDGIDTEFENPDPNADGLPADAQDTDADTIPDYLDEDDDGDTVDTALESPDPDGDGNPSDARDSDGDGTPDYLETDDDGDGIPSAQELALGTSPVLADSDDDGLCDGTIAVIGTCSAGEDAVGGQNSDADGLIDALDPDDDDDGILTATELTLGTTHTDPDSDADGLCDGAIAVGTACVAGENAESGQNSDTDGLIDALDADDDGDLIPTLTELTDSATLGNTDVDGTDGPNWLDTNADGDLLSDEVEGTGDGDGDGIPNYLDPDDEDGPLADADGDGIDNGTEDGLGTDRDDPDSDDDGLCDGTIAVSGVCVAGEDAEGGQNTDSDGLIDALDPDDDGDAIDTALELADATTHGDDVDSDTVPNWLDTDSDDDGVSDLNEGRADNDGDGVPAYLDADENVNPTADSDGDGLLDGEELVLGTDPFDADSDNDFIDDFRETDGGSPVDTDDDGDLDALDEDSDGDGLSDLVEGVVDTDGDTIGNWRDTDDDGDTILTATELADGALFGNDVDLDNIPNHLDLDSDKDGALDSEELVADDDGDGVPNYLDPDDTDGPDADCDGDGLTNAIEVALGTLPCNDDSDGDGIPDDVETDGGSATDTDGDATIDALDTDSDDDGVDDAIELTGDSDGDLTPDWRDTDDDGDGIDTAIESADSVQFGSDVDGDGTPNWLDTESDGDGTDDTTEGTADADADGVPNYLDPDDADGPDADADGDGLSNGTETSIGTNPYAADTDGDGIGDPVETNGGSFVDTDLDGIPDGADLDSDGDTLLDAAEGTTDSDGDGNGDWRDPDDDDDGLPTAIEALDATRLGSDVDGDGTVNWLDTESDGDATDDAVEGRGDADSDGIPNYLDADDTDGPGADPDGDGLSNLVETTVGTNPLIADSDGDSVLDGDEVGPDLNNPRDSDADGTIDALDPDDDDDGILTLIERADATALGNDDPDADGNPAWRDTDADGDGFDDTLEAGGDLAAPVDTDGDGTPDYLDTDSDDDGVVDMTDNCRTVPNPSQSDTDGNGVGDACDGVEDCSNETDDDMDGSIDCEDPDCAAAEVCMMPAEVCNDGTDEDGDGLVDCDDPDCTDDPACMETPMESCNDGTDDDGDGLIDCQDTDCTDDPACMETPAEVCDDDTDNDGDGDTDCDDADCVADAACTDGGGTEICDGGNDDDNDGLIDCDDPDCASDLLCTDPEVGLALDGGGCQCRMVSGATSQGSSAPLGMGLFSIGGLAGLALLRRRRRAARRASEAARAAHWLAVLLLAAGLATALSPGQALAQEVEAIQVEQFEPLPDQHTNILNVATSDTLGHLGFSVGTLMHFVSEPARVVLVDQDGEVLDEVDPVIDYQLKGELWAGLGLSDYFDLGVIMPFIFTQSVGAIEDGSLGGAVEDASLGDLRIVPRVRALPRELAGGFGIGVESIFYAPTGDKETFNSEEGFRVEPRLVLDYKHEDSGFVIAANAGYLFRSESSEALNIVNDDVVRLSLGTGIPLGLDGLQLIGSVFGSIQVEDSRDPTNPDETSDRFDSSPVEALGGIRYTAPFGLHANLGGGAGLNDAVGAPEYRVFASIGFLPLDDDYDDDGIVNRLDECPEVAEDRDGFEDDDGCVDPDNDQDQIADLDDTCPDDPEDRDNWKDEDGCPEEDDDTDGDGILNVADACIDVPEDLDAWKDEDGCPEEDDDTDGDGILNVADACIDVPEDFDQFTDEDGCPDADNDADGFCDPWVVQAGQEAQYNCKIADQCPNEAETVNNLADDDGCPDQKVVVEEKRIRILEKVYFKTDSATIKKESYPILNDVAAVLTANPQITKVRIEGHTDDVGKDKYNKKLSGKRAASVRKYLIDQGVEASRLSSEGYGEEKPIEPNDSEEGRAANRRVEFTILEVDGKPLETDY